MSNKEERHSKNESEENVDREINTDENHLKDDQKEIENDQKEIENDQKEIEKAKTSIIKYTSPTECTPVVNVKKVKKISRRDYLQK